MGASSGTIENSFYDSYTTGQSDTGKGVPKTTTEMMDITTFSESDWDHALVQDHDQEIWYIDHGNDYPRLWWEKHEEPISFDISLFAGGEADGWNFISLNLPPVDTSLASMLVDIDGNYDRLMYYDASTGELLTHIPGRPDHYNKLHSWNHRMGLWIRMVEY